jgi:8-oxo-dGTP diphosphatase
MAVAFLLSEEQEVLFLQKKPEDTFLAGYLVPIGGHIESDEINEPKKACLREIEEETGLNREYINNLTLRYIVLRNKENQEIRIQYVFFGNVSKNSTLIESDEGSLAWVNYKGISNLNVSATTNEIVKHYNEIGKSSEKVYVGSMKSLKGIPEITWGLLEDWELPIFN